MLPPGFRLHVTRVRTPADRGETTHARNTAPPTFPRALSPGGHREVVATEEPGAEDLQRRVKELQAELDGLRRALRSRATIEQAMGVLVVAHRCTPQQAFRLLIRLSQQHNIKLHRVADMLVQLAAKAETHQLEALLRQAAAHEGTEEAGSGAGDLDTALVAVARKLAGGSPEALPELHKLLLDRGWIPPYTVLAAALE